MTVSSETAREKLLDAALMHVPFDGWSEATFQAAIRDADLSAEVARSVCPRGAVDLAMAFHRRGDLTMRERLAETDLSGMKFREKVTEAVWLRLEAVDDKEAVRRGTTLFALPMHAADGARLIWETADAIWTTLGDRSDDVNWYTKRATLGGVWSATVLYWLGDDSPDHMATRAFLERRIEDVMQIEKFKAQVRNSPVLSKLMAGPNWLLGQIKAPTSVRRDDLPGSWTSPRN
ncbi:COQ9 family protein [uncultured Roseobacter sp.]|uniref:COQ9 family protein n=1 Tax=uncultured Roseobacter sp. TaxID=114847 RepID=UPI002633D8BD|nr:COQ9 family protein [uncultured Roseobacter sp.]